MYPNSVFIRIGVGFSRGRGRISGIYGPIWTREPYEGMCHRSNPVLKRVRRAVERMETTPKRIVRGKNVFNFDLR